MQTTVIDRWIAALDALEAPWGGPILVAGEGAGSLAAGCMTAGSAPLAAEGDDFAVLAAREIEVGPEGWTALAPGSMEMVVLRRGWRGRAGLATAVGAASRILAPSGRLVVADLDLDRLLGGSTVHYPYRLRFEGDAAAAERLRASTVSPGALAIEVTRVGVASLQALAVDEERALYESVQEYWEAVRDGAWPSLAEMADDEREPFLEWLGDELRRALPVGGAVDRRPWFAVTGVKR